MYEYKHRTHALNHRLKFFHAYEIKLHWDATWWEKKMHTCAKTEMDFMRTKEMQKKDRKCKVKCTKSRNTHLNKQHWLWLICPINEHLRSVFSVCIPLYSKRNSFGFIIIIFFIILISHFLFLFFFCIGISPYSARRVHGLVWPVFSHSVAHYHNRFRRILFHSLFISLSLSHSSIPFNSSSFWTHPNMHAQ